MEYKNYLVVDASETERATFYRKTYTHLAFSLLAFILVEATLLKIIPMEYIAAMLGGRFIWLFIIGLFWLGSVIASKWSYSPSKNMQYAGLGLYILLEAIIFLPMIAIAMIYTGPEILVQAGGLTLFLFAGLTTVVFMTQKDFSFLRSFIIIAGFISLGLIVIGAFFGLNLGLWFSVGMVILAGAGILYETHQIKNTYSTDQYVGAALQLFASIMLLFWYILRILMSRK